MKSEYSGEPETESSRKPLSELCALKKCIKEGPPAPFLSKQPQRPVLKGDIIIEQERKKKQRKMEKKKKKETGLP